jgi:hypothetical protein
VARRDPRQHCLLRWLEENRMPTAQHSIDHKRDERSVSVTNKIKQLRRINN